MPHSLLNLWTKFWLNRDSSSSIDTCLIGIARSLRRGLGSALSSDETQLTLVYLCCIHWECDPRSPALFQSRAFVLRRTWVRFSSRVPFVRP